jgi:thymidylate synthase
MNSVDVKYINLIEKIIKKGNVTDDRTKVGITMITNQVFKLNIAKHGFPLISVKKTNYDFVVKELLWFLSGSTNVEVLQGQGVHIWDNDINPQKVNTYPYGGFIYGHAWRHFGSADFKSGGDHGFDQINYIITCFDEYMKGNHKNDRRIMMSSWQADKLDKMALPPCHVSCQFSINYVDNCVDNCVNQVDCLVYQRSCDVMLGLPFNIAMYATLLEIICMISSNRSQGKFSFKPGKLTFAIGNCHIYNNHLNSIDDIRAAATKLRDSPSSVPKIRLVRPLDNIDDLTLADIELIDYAPQKYIKMQLN